MELKKLKIDGLTWYQWASKLFEFENCTECGNGIRGHIPSITPFGQWFAYCKKRKRC